MIILYIINVYKNSFQNRVNTDKSCLIEHNKMLTLEKEERGTSNYLSFSEKSCSVSHIPNLCSHCKEIA